VPPFVSLAAVCAAGEPELGPAAILGRD
jgi:hypothetical protein